MQVCVWLVGSGSDTTTLWQGQAAELCGLQPDATCCIGALAMWSLSRYVGPAVTFKHVTQMSLLWLRSLIILIQL